MYSLNQSIISTCARFYFFEDHFFVFKGFCFWLIRNSGYVFKKEFSSLLTTYNWSVILTATITYLHNIWHWFWLDIDTNKSKNVPIGNCLATGTVNRGLYLLTKFMPKILRANVFQIQPRQSVFSGERCNAKVRISFGFKK